MVVDESIIKLVVILHEIIEQIGPCGGFLFSVGEIIVYVETE